MGISNVGTTDSNSLKEITFTGIGGAGSNIYQGAIYKNKLIPAGTYDIELIPHGTVSVTAGSSNNTEIEQGNVSSRNGSILALDAVSGRPIAFYAGLFNNSQRTPFAGTISIHKDSFLQITLSNSGTSSNNIKYTLTLKPSISQLKTQVGFSMQQSVSPATSSSSHFIMGWDYDANEPAVIFNSGSNQPAGVASNSGVKVWSSGFFFVRKTSTGWTQRYLNNGLASGMSWYDAAGNGFGGRPMVDQGFVTGNGGFYIKNNVLHFFARQGMITDASSRRWGWVKTSIAGTALTVNAQWEPGHSNTNFADSSSSIATGNTGHMLYWYDARTNKVVYNGYRTSSNTDNFFAKWVEYDVITDTVTVSNSGWGSYAGQVYTFGYTNIWDSYWVDTERGYFGGFTTGTAGATYVIYKFAKDGSQLGFRQYPNVYYRFTSANTSTPQGSTGSFSAYAGRKALYFSQHSLGHGYISGASKTANNPYLVWDDTGFMRDNQVGLGGLSTSMSPNIAKSQIMFAGDKICVATSMLVVPSSQNGIESASNPYTHQMMMIATMPRNNVTEELMLPNSGGTYDPAVYSTNPGVYWLTDESLY